MPQQSEVIIATITSQVLAHNPLGDPPTRHTPIYLPPGYQQTDTHYPTVYLLTGFTGRGTFMLNDSAFDESIQERLDRLIATGQIEPMIVVMPDGFTRYGGSQYLNSTATGRYEDHLIQEVVPFVDQHYHTHPEPGYRAIGGKSSGGYAALVQGMRHPDVFGLIACHSGDLYFDYCYKPDFAKFLNAAARHGINSYETLRDFLADFSPKMFPKPAAFFDVIHISAMAACYSPNPDSPCGFDLPFEFHTGLLKPDVWQRWLNFDPINMLNNPQNVEALRQMRHIFIDCGNQDEYTLHYGARIFSQRLKELNIAHHHEEFAGGHRHTAFRYDVSLAFMSHIFSA